MQDAKSHQKRLRITTGGLVRYKKDVISYQKELKMQNEKLDKLVAEGGDEYTIKKNKELIQETIDVTENLKGKLKKQLEMVQDLVESTEVFPEVKETEQWTKTQDAVKDVEQYISCLLYTSPSPRD